VNASINPPASGFKARPRRNAKVWVGVAAAALLACAGLWSVSAIGNQTAKAAPPPATPEVTVSAPLQRDLDTRIDFLGQFAAVNQVEVRAQVGGALTQIRFKDGDVVHKGQLLFQIDPVPYEIRMSQAAATLAAANAHLELADHELTRAQTLVKTDAGTVEAVEQRTADKRAALAAVEGAKAGVRDARFDLDHCRVVAPFTGRIGTHLVSTGNLIAGSRTASSPTTLLTTIVSLDPIYLNFDMSEAEFQAFQRARALQKGPLADQVGITLGDETDFHRQGRLDFIDNALDRSSGVIHARATVANPDASLTAGEFARLAVSAPAPTLLAPDSAVFADQSGHVVLTVGPNGTVTPKPVEIGDLRDGLRVIRSGLTAQDRVIIGGLAYAAPGAKVRARPGTITVAAVGRN
jgi:multidrug efflux system membrane fusion protein